MACGYEASDDELTARSDGRARLGDDVLRGPGKGRVQLRKPGDACFSSTYMVAFRGGPEQCYDQRRSRSSGAWERRGLSNQSSGPV